VELPEVTEIQRWEIRPGDKLILRTDRQVVDQEQAAMLQERVRAILHLPPDVDVLILGPEWRAEVVSNGTA
jgi:hypothetical protein